MLNEKGRIAESFYNIRRVDKDNPRRCFFNNQCRRLIVAALSCTLTYPKRETVVFNCFSICLKGGGDVDQDGREKIDVQEKVSPYEEDKSPEMKVGDENDPAKANGRGLLNGMERDCKDFQYV